MSNENKTALTAEELINKFKPLVTTWDCYHDTPRNYEDIIIDAKKCALIAIEHASLQTKDKDKEIEELKGVIKDLSNLNNETATTLGNRESYIDELQSQLSEVTKERDKYKQAFLNPQLRNNYGRTCM